MQEDTGFCSTGLRTGQQNLQVSFRWVHNQHQSTQLQKPSWGCHPSCSSGKLYLPRLICRHCPPFQEEKLKIVLLYERKIKQIYISWISSVVLDHSLAFRYNTFHLFMKQSMYYSRMLCSWENALVKQYQLFMLCIYCGWEELSIIYQTFQSLCGMKVTRIWF